MSEVTQILTAMNQGEPKAADELLPLVYDELRQLAEHKLTGEPTGHTLQATALVHEAWLRLGRRENLRFVDRVHFFAVAAEAMRRILVESARRKQRMRHGGGQERVQLDQCEIAAPSDEARILLVNDALEALELADPLQAQVVKLRFFSGFSNAEAAQALEISEKTVQRYWAHAKAWLFERIQHMT